MGIWTLNNKVGIRKRCMPVKHSVIFYVIYPSNVSISKQV